MQQERSLGRALAGTGSPVNFAGEWKNELTSKMTLHQSNDVLSGSYESAVSGAGGKTTGALQGYVDGDLIAFVVHWHDYQAVTSWVGQLESGGSEETIKALWQMTKQVTPGAEWSSINAGSDTFTRMSP